LKSGFEITFPSQARIARTEDAKPHPRKVQTAMSLCWWTPDGRTIAIGVAVHDGTTGGVEASRHLLQFVFSDKAGALTGKDAAVFLLFVHAAPFTLIKCLPLTWTRACPSLSPRKADQGNLTGFYGHPITHEPSG
jgi:hypothetical protein